MKKKSLDLLSLKYKYRQDCSFNSFCYIVIIFLEDWSWRELMLSCCFLLLLVGVSGKDWLAAFIFLSLVNYLLICLSYTAGQSSSARLFFWPELSCFLLILVRNSELKIGPQISYDLSIVALLIFII